MAYSSTNSPHAFWLNVDKKKSSRSRWYNYLSGKTVPRDDIVQYIENEVPGTSRIFNALFWSILKGTIVSQEQVSRELDILLEAYAGPHFLFTIDFWMQEMDENSDKFLEPAIKTIYGNRTGSDFLELTILIMALADNVGNTNLWNYMCGVYREFLPLYISNIRWPFKAEIFDELDKYIQKRVLSGVDQETIKLNWRDKKTKVLGCVEKEYNHVLGAAIISYDVDQSSLPENFSIKLAKILADEFCKTEDVMLYSWHLCDAISDDIAETILDIQLFGEGDVSIERIMRYIESMRYFENASLGYNAYAKFDHIRKYHFNFFP